MAAPHAAPPHVSPRAMWISKLCLRFVQFVFSLTMLGLMGSMMSSGLYGITSLFFAGPATAVSMIWTTAESICIVVRPGRRGIHPGANVALDLILWLLFIPATAALSFISLASDFEAAVDEQSSSDYGGRRSSSSSSEGGSSSPGYGGGSSYGGGYIPDDPYSSFTADSGHMGVRARATSGNQDIQRVAAQTQALVGLGAMLVILHFVTFMIACVETHQRRKKRHNAATFVVHATQNSAEQGIGGYHAKGNESQGQFASTATLSPGYNAPANPKPAYAY